MPVTINGDGSITGLAVGGLPDGCVDADTLAAGASVPADGSITTAKLANGAATQAKRTYAAGEIVQVKYQVQGTNDFGMNSTNETDVTGMTIDFTLQDASNNILVEFTYAPYMAGSGASQYRIRAYRDSTQLYQNAQGFYRTNDDLKCNPSVIRFLDTGVSDTNSHTYKMTAQRTSGDDGFSIYAESGAQTNCVTCMEIKV